MSIASRGSKDLLSHGGTVWDRIGMLYILTNKRLTPVPESVPLSHANLFIVCPIEADDLINNKYSLLTYIQSRHFHSKYVFQIKYYITDATP